MKSIEERLAYWHDWHINRSQILEEASLHSYDTSLSLSEPSEPFSVSRTRKSSRTLSRSPLTDVTRFHITNFNARMSVSPVSPRGTFESTPKESLHAYRSWLDTYKENNRLPDSQTKIEGENAETKKQVVRKKNGTLSKPLAVLKPTVLPTGDHKHRFGRRAILWEVIGRRKHLIGRR
ncbi:hypothetical protein Moror_3863 [Moniliophthora roreri MCA 2997]|uniref:Uncharacterized protein n=2 Tax=Moniliophthora roreri TaxID=221103 RepID=V2XS94_MONRO|nr:hypothetical protein Moror_3863 [Moniliophthora roreri MCA 2997]